MRNKRWSSFKEMKEDLEKEGILKTNAKDSQEKSKVIETLLNATLDAQNANTSKEFFDITCRLSALFENIEKAALKSFFVETNFYILLLNAIFYNNISFQKSLINVTNSNVEIFDSEKKKSDLELKIFLNSAISLAFFPISHGISFLEKQNISFIRKHLSDLVRFILNSSSGTDTFSNLCFKLEDAAWEKTYQFKSKFPTTLKDKEFFKNLGIGRSIAGISFLSIATNSTLADHFNKIAKKLNSESFNLANEMSAVYGTIYRIEKSEKSYFQGFPLETSIALKDFFKNFVPNNEINLLFFIKQISSDFVIRQDKNFSVVLLEKIKKAEFLKGEFVDFAQKNLKAFEGNIGEEGNEWSNKILIASSRLLAVLSLINLAKDERWKILSALYEFTEWIEDVHNILNKNSIEDDWSLISNYVKQETTEIEWKSTFFTPVQAPFINKEADDADSKKIFEKIVKTILGMINTSGGVLIIGLIENPEKLRKEFEKQIFYKNNRAFFNINDEFAKTGSSLDQTRLKVFSQLKQITKFSQEKFNELVFFESILLKNSDSKATVIKITVKKSEQFFFNVDDSKGNLVWISLTMRGPGQTLDVDIRDYIRLPS